METSNVVPFDRRMAKPKEFRDSYYRWAIASRRLGLQIQGICGAVPLFHHEREALIDLTGGAEQWGAIVATYAPVPNIVDVLFDCELCSARDSCPVRGKRNSPVKRRRAPS